MNIFNLCYNLIIYFYCFSLLSYLLLTCLLSLLVCSVFFVLEAMKCENRANYRSTIFMIINRLIESWGLGKLVIFSPCPAGKGKLLYAPQYCRSQLSNSSCDVSAALNMLNLTNNKPESQTAKQHLKRLVLTRETRVSMYNWLRQ